MKAWPVLAILLVGCFSGESIEGEAGTAPGEAVEASLLTFHVDGAAGAPAEPDEPEVSEDDPVDWPAGKPVDAGAPRPLARADGGRDGDGDGGTQSDCPAGFVCKHVQSLLGSDVCVLDGDALPPLCVDGGCDAYPAATCIGFQAGEYCVQSCML